VIFSDTGVRTRPAIRNRGAGPAAWRRAARGRSVRWIGGRWRAGFSGRLRILKRRGWHVDTPLPLRRSTA